MKALDKSYQIQLDKVIEELQASDDLAKYLDEEEEQYYQSLKDTYEPRIKEIFDAIALNNPLQLIAFEKALLNEQLEGMYLPRILGFSVLRGEINEHYKYSRPQNHFRDILYAICTSGNFDILKKRIGQTIQVGFAFSSDIWITNFLNEIPNKKIRQFLQAQKMPVYRDLKGRSALLFRYKNQFKNENFYTCDFPTNTTNLSILGSSIKNFIIYRITNKLDNSSIRPSIINLLENKEMEGHLEHSNILQLYANFFQHDGPQLNKVKAMLAQGRGLDDFTDNWIAYHLELQEKKAITPESDLQVHQLLDHSVEDDLSNLYKLFEIIHTQGYLHEAAVEAVRNYYVQYEGLSANNEVVRRTILNYIVGVFDNLTVDNYTEYFELSKIFPVYMNIFGNEEFNLELKQACVKYVKQLKKRYTDKRGKDYQDIKKFVMANFTDLKFMKEKQIVEFFKTKRKKKVVAES